MPRTRSATKTAVPDPEPEPEPEEAVATDEGDGDESDESGESQSETSSSESDVPLAVRRKRRLAADDGDRDAAYNRSRTRSNRRHVCSECESTYTRADHLARHKAVRHPENSPPKIHCICGRTFQRRDVLIRHQKQSCLGSVEDQIRLYGGTKKRKLGCRQSENSLAHLASVATGDEGTESPNKTTTACRPCAVSKVRCEGAAGDSPCTRCKEIGLRCLSQSALPRKRPRQNSKDQTPNRGQGQSTQEGYADLLPRIDHFPSVFRSVPRSGEPSTPVSLQSPPAVLRQLSESLPRRRMSGSPSSAPRLVVRRRASTSAIGRREEYQAQFAEPPLAPVRGPRNGRKDQLEDRDVGAAALLLGLNQTSTLKIKKRGFDTRLPNMRTAYEIRHFQITRGGDLLRRQPLDYAARSFAELNAAYAPRTASNGAASDSRVRDGTSYQPRAHGLPKSFVEMNASFARLPDGQRAQARLQPPPHPPVVLRAVVAHSEPASMSEQWPSPLPIDEDSSRPESADETPAPIDENRYRAMLETAVQMRRAGEVARTSASHPEGQVVHTAAPQAERRPAPPPAQPHTSPIYRAPQPLAVINRPDRSEHRVPPPPRSWKPSKGILADFVAYWAHISGGRDGYENYLLDAYMGLVHPTFPILHRPSFALESAHPVLQQAVIALALHYLGRKAEAQSVLQIVVRQLSIFSIEMGSLLSSPMPVQQARLLADYLSFMIHGHHVLGQDIIDIISAGAVKEAAFRQPIASTSYERWQIWLGLEEQRRLAFGHIMLGCLAATTMRAPHSPLHIGLASMLYRVKTPSSNLVWDCTNSFEWEREIHREPSSLSTGSSDKVWRTIGDLDAFPAAVAQLALDVLAGDDAKMQTRKMRPMPGENAKADALWTLVDLQDLTLNSPMPDLAALGSAARNSFLLRQLGIISLQIPLYLLLAFTRPAERNYEPIKEKIRVCVMKDGSSRGRRMFLAGMQIWKLLGPLQPSELNECLIAPYAIFYATCAVYLYAHTVRLATHAVYPPTSEMASSPDFIPERAAKLYVDRAAIDGDDIALWLSGRVPYNPCIAATAYIRKSGSLLQSGVPESLVEVAREHLKCLSVMQAHCADLLHDLKHLPELAQPAQRDDRSRS